MKTKKTFVGLESAYALFQRYSTQQRCAAEQLLRRLPSVGRRQLRLCFFGCGDLELITQVVTSLSSTHEIEVTLVDLHAGWRNAALATLSQMRVLPPRAFSEWPTGAQFDLIVAHHTLYYVPDVIAACRFMHAALPPHGTLAVMLASSKNQLKQCAVDLFGIKQQRLSYWLEEDVKQALQATGCTWQSSSIMSLLNIPDSPDARAALIRFLTGELFSEGITDPALQVFAPHERDGHLQVPMDDTLFMCRPTAS